jgi:hypothetical protein
MRFFNFRQNNSGGSFDYIESEGITVNVIIEAKYAEDANITAIQKGLYFDGCSHGQDCSCCGDRWYRVDESEGTKVPMIYGEKLGTKAKPSKYPSLDRGWMESGKETAVHYADGRVEWYRKDNTLF